MTYLKKPISKFIVVGYSTREHLLIDLDKTTLSKILKLTKLIMNEYPNVGDALIVLSSTPEHKEELIYSKPLKPTLNRILPNYHLIFDNRIGYNSCDRILKDLVGIGVIDVVADKLRGLRSCMTLRVSPKIMMIGTRPSPRVVHIVFNELTNKRDGCMWKYLNQLYMVKRVFYDWMKPSDPQSLFQKPIQQSYISNPQ